MAMTTVGIGARSVTYSLDTAAQNFFALYAVEIIHGYPDGRIKARTALGAYCDLPRSKNFETDTYVFHITQWLDIIRGADAYLGSRPRR